MTRVDGVGYTFANNGNLLTTGLLTNTFDAANRLIETRRAGTTLQPSYDGLGNRVGQTVGLSTTSFALDSAAGLPEVIATSAGKAYLHLPGVIVTEDAIGEVRYLLSDSLGSVRQAVDERGTVVVYNEFDPYGNPILHSSFLISNYDFTGEWWEAEVGLLYLRARWYAPETGTFLSRDPVEGEPTYLYVRENPINRIDPSGFFPHSVIENSLGNRKLGDAFKERRGLYYLLRDADNHNTVDPLVVDFQETSHVQYPLRNPMKNTVAEVTCENNNLSFHLLSRIGAGGSNSTGLTLPQYLRHLEDAARQEFNLSFWRDETVRLHYYRLIHRTGTTFYEDFGGASYLPDYLAFSGFAARGLVGGGSMTLGDRYGNSYRTASLSFGWGVSIKNLSLGGNYVEGYGNSHNIFKTKLSVPSETALKNSITGLGFTIGGGALVGYGRGEPIPLPGSEPFNPIDYTSFTEYSIGLEVGVGASFGYGWTSGPKDETKAWAWLDRIRTGKRHYNAYYLPPEYAEATYSGNDCSCGSP